MPDAPDHYDDNPDHAEIVNPFERIPPPGHVIYLVDDGNGNYDHPSDLTQRWILSNYALRRDLFVTLQEFGVIIYAPTRPGSRNFWSTTLATPDAP